MRARIEELSYIQEQPNRSGRLRVERAGGGVQLTMDTVGISPWRIDHIYASPALAPGLRRAAVERCAGFRHDGPQVKGLWVHSDHLPVVAEFAGD